MGLPIRIETRTGDTPSSKRQRQRRDPPEILLTTPEQLALLLASADAPYLFGSLKRVILDELHALVTSKRGDLLSLGLARLFRLAPDLTSIGLSATVAEPDDLCRFMVPQRGGRCAGRSHRRRSRRRARCRHARQQRAACRGPAIRRAMRSARSITSSRRTAPRWSSSTPAARPKAFSRTFGTSTTTISPSRCITARSTWRSGARSKPRWRPAACARWCARPRSISASTGATSIWSSMSARRRAPRACCSASAAPITAWTSRRRACWCRPTASKCWNAAPRSTPSPRMPRTRRRRASARSTCWPSTCSAAPAARRS